MHPTGMLEPGPTFAYLVGMCRRILTIALALVSFPSDGQNRTGTGSVVDLYETHCSICHGKQLEGGLGGSLLGKLDHVNSDEGIQRWISAGNPDFGMPGFAETLSEADIRSLVIYIREMRRLAEKASAPSTPTPDAAYEFDGVRFRIEPVISEGLETPWSVCFLPDNSLLITERPGRLRPIRDGKVLPAIEGVPEAWVRGQGGLLDVVPHPNFASNRWIYLAFSEARGDVGSIAIVRGRIRDGQWVDEERIFYVPETHLESTAHHFGTRLAFRQDYLFFAIGDRGRQDKAQDPASPNGRIHRIHDDGRIPDDNPFRETPGAFASSWTLGNRNIQGLDVHPITGDLWATEHGPRGGDELNLIRPGLNYGWPLVTHGMNYQGTPITSQTGAPGLEPPALHWTPSISPCGIEFYEGSLFPEWKHYLFIGGLASRELHCIAIEEGHVVSDRIVLSGIGRIRDVATGPDGALYLLLNDPDSLVRLVPERDPAPQ